ncbi:unnamed protein product [marine sediment metagenome]|uniref:Uncharacterized protein n=1 Tax=marine sediment metagenome TaxID=412755 RepID=X1TZK7_9ZZZZ
MEEVAVGRYKYVPESKTWDVRMDEEAWFECKKQVQAEVLSHLVRMESLLKQLVDAVKKS